MLETDHVTLTLAASNWLIVLRYIFALFLMILGHAFAFMVINYGKKTEDEKDSFDKTKESHQTHSFDSPWKIFVMTITMALGEFQVILVASGPH